MAFSFDDAWDNGPEVTRAGTAAFGLYCRCGAWSARNLQDGFVPAEIASGYGTPEWARKLVDAGLWEICEGGYRMPHFFDRNDSADKVRQRRKADAERKARWREEKKSRRDSERSHTQSPSGIRSTPLPYGRDARAREAGRERASPVDNPAVIHNPAENSVAEALRHPADGCDHGDPRGPEHCGLCRRGIPAEEEP